MSPDNTEPVFGGSVEAAAKEAAEQRIEANQQQQKKSDSEADRVLQAQVGRFGAALNNTFKEIMEGKPVPTEGEQS